MKYVTNLKDVYPLDVKQCPMNRLNAKMIIKIARVEIKKEKVTIYTWEISFARSIFPYYIVACMQIIR